MKNSIIILTRDAEETIGKILRSIYSQNCFEKYEVIIIDSGSEDKTTSIIKSFPAILIEQSPSAFHHAKTRNLGAEISSGEILIFLNGDAFPSDKNWILKLTQHFIHEDVSAVYGKQLPLQGINPINQFRMMCNYGDKRIIKTKDSLSKYGIRTYFFSTANCAIRKSVWESFRFPEYIPVYEDTAFIKNIINAGYKVVYEPDAIVYHAHNYSIFDIFQKYFDTGYIYKFLGYFEKTSSRLESEGISYLKSGVIFLARQGYLLWIPYFILHSAMGFIGLFIGKYSYRLPSSIRKMLSKYGTS